jgi:ribosomal protein L44E
LIHHTCFKCKRRFELDPVFVGFELGKLKKKNPNHYQAICPACRAVNKVSVEQMQAELDSVAEEIQQMIAEYEQKKAEDRAAKQAGAAEKKAKAQKK